MKDLVAHLKLDSTEQPNYVHTVSGIDNIYSNHSNKSSLNIIQINQ